MIGQGATHTHSSSSPPLLPPPHPNLTSLVGDANVDMLACSPYDNFASAPPSDTANSRRPSLKAPHPSEVLKCPRCDSLDTKFCYYNNYSLTQPRYFCKNCKRYWTAGGALRNVPVGGGLRKNKRSKLKLAADAEAALAAQAMAVGTVQQQQQKAGALGAGAAGEVHQKLDNRTSVPANAAMPSHVAVGIPEMGMYPHPSRGGVALHNYGEAMLDQNSGAVVNPQEGDFYGRSAESKGAGLNYFVEPGHAPQFYSSYAPRLPVGQYGNSITGGVESGFPMNYTFLPPSENASNAHAEEATNERLAHEADASINSSASKGAAKQEKDAEASVNPYDWQLISEGLFNSGGSTVDGNFLYMPSSSWPDFSHFNDGGPG